MSHHWALHCHLRYGHIPAYHLRKISWYLKKNHWFADLPSSKVQFCSTPVFFCRFAQPLRLLPRGFKELLSLLSQLLAAGIVRDHQPGASENLVTNKFRNPCFLFSHAMWVFNIICTQYCLWNERHKMNCYCWIDILVWNESYFCHAFLRFRPLCSRQTESISQGGAGSWPHQI